MKKLVLAVVVAIGSLFATMSAATAASVAPAPMSLPYEMAADAIKQSVLPVHWAGPRHNCRVHGACGGGGIYLGGPGIYFGPGYVGPGRSCRRVRRFCRREWGGGRSYRRCVRRRDCRP